jgi:hypothetical protein
LVLLLVQLDTSGKYGGFATLIREPYNGLFPE